MCVIGTYLASKHLSVSELCFQAKGVMASAAIVEARSSGDAQIIADYNERGWLGMRGHMECNLVAPTRTILMASRIYTERLMDWADSVGAAAIIVEGGYDPQPSGATTRRLTSSLRSICRTSQSGASLLIENGSRPETISLSAIRHAIDMCDDDRVGIHLNLTSAFAYGYALEDLYAISRDYVRSVQISLPDTRMESGCTNVTIASLENSKWGAEEIQQLVRHFDGLPIIINSTNPHDWALVDCGAWESIAILRDDNFSHGDSKDNSLGQVESS